MKANKIVNVLNSFKDSSYKKILIDGNWGIGKTKYVLDFMEEHSNVCYVSLFGKKDTDSILQEIYFRIIDEAPTGSIKKHISILRNKMKNFDVSFSGISLSIPVIENIYNNVRKEIGKLDAYIIIFDDLERKHEDLSIKEILGILDNLSKLDNIKTVLISATNQLDGNSRDIFEDYKEKAIDRTYIVDKYADEAPVKILSEKYWNVIKKFIDGHKFNNLRTFEKINQFINEVIQSIGEDALTDKFTEHDLVKMCFAAVFFYTEHKGEFILLDSQSKSAPYLKAVYEENTKGAAMYLNRYILKDSLNNISEDILGHLIEWYAKGSYKGDVIVMLIKSMEKYDKAPPSFYSSENDIRRFIDQSKNFIRNLNGNESLNDIVSDLSNALLWCEVLSIDYGITNKEILTMLRGNIINNINVKESFYKNSIHTWSIRAEDNEQVKEIIKLIDDTIRIEYTKQVIQHIKSLLRNRSYDKTYYIQNLRDLVITNDEEEIKLIILRGLEECNYFFPLPAGAISEEHWYWCHLVKELVVTIEGRWEIEGFFNKFREQITKNDEVRKDLMLKHRLKGLFDKK